MKKAKVIAIGSGAQNVVRNKKAQKLFDVFAIDCKEGCGNDVERGRAYGESVIESLDEFMAHSERETIFIVSTLGGGMGCGATPVVVEHLAAMEKRMIAIVTLPLAFEGGAKHDRAMRVVGTLTRHCRITVEINQELVMSEQKENTPMSKFFGIIDNEIYRLIEMHVRNNSWWTRLLAFIEK